MTTTDPRDELLDADARAIAAMQRALLARIAETRAIDTRAALEGIRARRLPPRSRRHSVPHRAYR